MKQPLVLWCVTDNKPGHRSQMEGLVAALARLRELSVRWLDCRYQTARAQLPDGERPALIFATGSHTHLTALRLKWQFGGRLVLLLKPSLPLRLFDLCVIPEHDGVNASSDVLVTTGTINDIQPATAAEPDQGLILIGGPSRHHGWSDKAMLAQLHTLVHALAGTSWTLTTSRRTPPGFCEAVAGMAGERFKVVPVADTNRDWLRRQFARCSMIWVSEDSASMVYEALSSGARVGVLDVPRNEDSRVSRGLDKLLARGAIDCLHEVQLRGEMQAAGRPLQEARRVAQHLHTWLNQTEPAAPHENPSGPSGPQ